MPALGHCSMDLSILKTIKLENIKNLTLKHEFKEQYPQNN